MRNVSNVSKVLVIETQKETRCERSDTADGKEFSLSKLLDS